MNGCIDVDTNNYNHLLEDSEFIISKIKKSRCSLLEDDLQHGKYSEVVQKLEEVEGCFVCGECFAFSSWQASDLSQHYSVHHPDDSHTLCPYCFCMVAVQGMGEHQLAHFMPSKSQGLYGCPLCTLFFDDKKSFLIHCQETHPSTAASLICDRDSFPCLGCDMKFSTATLLANHIEEHIRPLFYCQIAGCLVKSCNKLSVQRHLGKRHPSQHSTAIGSTEYVSCAVKKLPVGPSMTKPGSTAEPGVVYCLKCPYCSFTTVNWAKFSQHQTHCPRCPTSCFKYFLSHCSECGAVSTERALIKEHIICTHEPADDKAYLLQEEVGVTLIPPSSGRAERVPGSILAQSLSKQPELADEAFSSLSGSSLKRAAPEYSADEELASNTNKISRLDDAAAPGSENMSFPFDEETFRKSFPPNPDTEAVVEKMRKFCCYQVKILRKENHRRIPECPECKKAFPYGLGDFKRHLMTVHLDIPREFIKECLRCTHLPKAEAPFQELQEQLAMKNFKPVLIDHGRRRIPLPFSTAVLRRLTLHFSKESQDYLIHKMKTYSTLHVVMDTRNGKKYQCGSCNYLSPHALADVRKHILGSHCGISTKHFRYCLQASRLDPVEFTLLADDKLFRLAKDFVRRSRKPPANQNGVPDPAKSEGHSESLSTPSNSTEGADSKERDLGCLSLTIDKSIIPPIFSSISFPGSLNGDADNDNQDDSADVSAVPSDSEDQARVVSQSPSRSAGVPSHHGQNASHFEEADDVDEEEVISLPFSESVLRHLTDSILDKGHQDMVVAKMRTYSSFQLVRQMCKGKTVAYRCACGRVFHTVRRPEKTVRPSTLADARRHVMGVHARINHEMLTTCCQASRISRENNWRLYSDDMLLRLASERPPKAVVQKSFEESNGLGNGNSFHASDPQDNSQVSFSDVQDDETMNDEEGGDSTDEKHEGNLSVFPSMLYDPQPVWPSMAEGAVKSEPSVKVELDNSSFFASNFSTRSEPPIQPHEITTAEQRVCTLTALPKEKIERIIDLPYSFDALCALVEGQCDEETLRIMREKMDLYADYKVVVTREGPKRYFRCSGCSACSPHGMGDIRKHILGVHAKIPDRFKTACLHGSRLSREDNRLLPDTLLLQLAKLKWKGTVGSEGRKMPKIGPLKSSNSKSSFNFDSMPTMVPIKGLSNSEGKVKVGGKSKVTLTTCIDGDEGSTVKLQELRVPVKMEVPAERPYPPPDLFIVKVRGKDKVFQCSKCSFTSHHAGPVRGHIVRDHMKIPCYRCTICHSLYALKNDVITHHKLEHRSKPFQHAQFSSYRYAMSRVLVKSSSSTEKIKIKLSFKKDPDAESEQVVIENRAESPADEDEGENGEDEEDNGEEEEFAEEDELMEEDGDEVNAEEEGADEASDEVNAEEEDVQEEEVDTTSSAVPAPVMVNGKEMLIMPNNLEKPVDPAPAEDCFAIRRRGNYGDVHYFCSICSIASKTQGSVKDHIVQYHMGIFPFHCHICNSMFWSKEVLATHFEEEHPDTQPRTTAPQKYRDAIKNVPTRSSSSSAMKQRSKSSKTNSGSASAAETGSQAGSESASSIIADS